MTHDAVAGIDIGGTMIHGVVMSPAGEVLACMSAPTPIGGRAVLRRVDVMVRDLARRASVDVTATGVGATGIIEAGTGRIIVATSAFRDWVGHSLVEELELLLNMPVAVANDVKAFLLGEMRWGALRDTDDALGVTIGTGVGGAIALEGRLLEGRFSGAGEIGHIPGYSNHVCTCGGVGHLDTVASGPSIGLRYAERSGNRGLTGLEVAGRARAGDPDALAVLLNAGRALSDALVSAATLLDISHVVVGGGVVGAWDLLAPLLRDRIAANPLISKAELIVRPSTAPHPAMGPASLVMQPSTLEARSALTDGEPRVSGGRTSLAHYSMRGTNT